jgi:PhnB protein
MPDVRLNSVTPELQVADLQRALDFYQAALGFTRGWIVGEPPWLASVCCDAVEFHLHKVETPVPSHVYLNVNDVDAYFGAAVSAGARVIHPLEDRHYGMRDGRIADPDGNHIGIGENIE